jgi:hypothetical protein
MIGFVVTPEQSEAANAAIADAQTSRGMPVFWLPGMYEIKAGQHAGSWLIPADDQILNTPLMGSPAQTPQDFPEFAQIIASLGGLDARVEINSQDLIDPSISEE